ncbi:hypothetical protein TSOC_001530 [Tetrabaena socialis]|uniref:Uncharacterized protein n=1 Tax=Tetrabaena socialis TaxID=47790 RepID=A0A2J8AGL6_9CHLO|nr:hypothetical protein TSOC_001530 [Tetrabaena socialis]|eukprot:PNH11651.1 hypothetical protein TSOC_001530 [Tetrabaena socialis]
MLLSLSCSRLSQPRGYLPPSADTAQDQRCWRKDHHRKAGCEGEKLQPWAPGAPGSFLMVDPRAEAAS